MFHANVTLHSNRLREKVNFTSIRTAALIYGFCFLIFPQDVLYPGNLSGTREFKEAGNDLRTYVSSVTSIRTADKMHEDASGLKACGGIIGEMFDVSLLRSPTFIIICVSGFIVYLGQLTAIVVYLVVDAVHCLDIALLLARINVMPRHC